jgi:hypothetical protein
MPGAAPRRPEFLGSPQVLDKLVAILAGLYKFCVSLYELETGLASPGLGCLRRAASAERGLCGQCTIVH